MKNTRCNRVTDNTLALKILHEIRQFRRVHALNESCTSACSLCSEQHIETVMRAVSRHDAVTFVLPAFPGKSPNHEKVLGVLPDYAERLSLIFLNDLAKTIKSFYAPGVKIILCSDGRVFSDIVGMQERHVTAYQQALQTMIDDMSLTSLSCFNLEDHYKNLHYMQMRDELMKRYGCTLDFLKDSVRNGAQAFATAEQRQTNQLYRGITRFLFEDAIYAGVTDSRTALQKRSRAKAYEVIRRSNAWTELIADIFPDAVRLSIHPQACGSKKLGIRLIANESWMTPWHGVAVETPSGFVLRKRHEAEAMGAVLVCSSNGKPSHYQLTTELPLVA
ncbi:MAG: isocyanide synthase family protein [Coxiellaceae bacterium]|nr:isocyanide synthase family protein [Coxiellaceae bacterium]